MMDLDKKIRFFKYLLIVAAGFVSISYYNCFNSKEFSIFLLIVCIIILIGNIIYDIGLENIKEFIKKKNSFKKE